MWRRPGRGALGTVRSCSPRLTPWPGSPPRSRSPVASGFSPVAGGLGCPASPGSAPLAVAALLRARPLRRGCPSAAAGLDQRLPGLSRAGVWRRGRGSRSRRASAPLPPSLRAAWLRRSSPPHHGVVGVARAYLAGFACGCRIAGGICRSRKP